MSKAQGLPMSTIVIAILVLLVLVILSVAVYKRTEGFNKGLKELSEETCEPENEKKFAGTDCKIIYASFKDLGPGEICCRKGTVE